MSLARSARVLLTAFLLVVPLAGGLAATPAAAAPVPVSPAFGPIIDDYADYEPEDDCDPTAKPGPLALQDLLTRTYGTASFGIGRTCGSGSSGHYAGRALDWMHDVSDPEEKDEADTFLNWLFADDQYGNPDAMLRRMGIMYVIWNKQIYESYDPGWEPYYGSSPHTDHVHFSFSWDGAYQRTTYWNLEDSFVTSPPCVTPPTQPAPPAVDYGAGLGYVTVTPKRLLDTRAAGVGVPSACRLAPSGRLDVKVTGVGGVPSTGVGAVVLNVTGVSPAGGTWLAAYPAGAVWPGNSSASVQRSAITATLVVVPVGSNGMVSLRNGPAATDALVDIVGYHPLSGGSAFRTTTPTRALDTRQTGNRFRSGELRTVALPGLPARATGAIVNVAAIDPTTGGYITVSAGSSGTRGGTSSLNVSVGRVVSNRAYVAVGPGSTIDIYASTATNLLVDVVGWFGPSGLRYVPVTPLRAFDSRNDIGGLVPFTGGVAQELDVTAAGVPTAARAVVMTLTTTGLSTDTYATAWAHGTAQPGTSDINAITGADTSNLVVTGLGEGSLDAVIGHGTGNLVGDIVGYFR